MRSGIREDIQSVVAALKTRFFSDSNNYQHVFTKTTADMNIPICFKPLPEGINSMLLPLADGQFKIIVNDTLTDEEQLRLEILANLAHISLSHFNDRGYLDPSIIEEEALLFCNLFTMGPSGINF